MHTIDNRVPAEVHPNLQSPSEHKQALIMRVAFVLLMSALAVVAVRDWQLWSNMFFPEDQVTESVPVQTGAQSGATTTTPAPTTRSHSKANRIPIATTHSEIAVAPIVTTNRTVLPPLQVDVVAGNRHQAVQSSNRAVEVNVEPSPQVAASQSPGVVNASDRSTLSQDTAGIVSRRVDPSYPMLAKQMKVQGAVILQALIGRSGDIQNLRVLSGPAMLSEAARSAVKQWHFKPYLLAGQAVETEARITVNFTISTD
jgi:TonB family protein